MDEFEGKNEIWDFSFKIGQTMKHGLHKCEQMCYLQFDLIENKSEVLSYFDKVIDNTNLKKEDLNLNQEEGLQKYMQKKFVLLVQHLIA